MPTTPHERRLADLLAVDWRHQDKEAVAACYVKLARAGKTDWTDTQLAEAAKYCYMAGYASLYGTFHLDTVAFFARESRRFNAARAVPDPVAELNAWQAEMLAMRRTGRTWTAALDQAVACYRAARRRLRAPGRQAPWWHDAAGRELARKGVRLLWGRALQHADRGRLPRAAAIARLALARLEALRLAKKRGGAPLREAAQGLKILALLLLRAGRTAEALACFDGLHAGAFRPDVDRDVAWLLSRSGLPDALRRALPFLDRAAGHDRARFAIAGKVEPTTWLLLVEDAIRLGRIDDALARYGELAAELARRQRAFVLPGSLDGFLGEYAGVYGTLLDALWEHGRPAAAALPVVADAFWATALPAAEEHDDPAAGAALEGRLGDTARVDLAARPGETRIVFYPAARWCYRFRLDGGAAAWERLPVGAAALAEEVEGVRAALLNDGIPGGVLDLARGALAARLFAGLPEDGALAVTAAAPLAAAPWAALADGRTLSIRAPYATPPRSTADRAMTGNTTATGGILSLTEDGTTLPQAPAEHAALAALFPDGAHLVFGAASPAVALDDVAARLAGARRFHFAGHGYTSARAPESSGLAVSGPGGEAVLTVARLAALDLGGLELAVLNSCSSADGPRYASQLATHVAAALVRAGARAVAASIAPIPDEASARFTDAFWRASLAGATPAAACAAGRAAAGGRAGALYVLWTA